MSSNSKAAKPQSPLPNDKQLEIGGIKGRGAEDNDETEYGTTKKEESVSVTRELLIKPSKSSQNLHKEVVLRKIRQRKRVNKFRAAIGALLSWPFSANTGEASVQQKRWVDDAFAAL